MMSEQEVHLSVAQWIIKFLTSKDVKAVKIVWKFKVQFTYKTLKKTQVYEWQKILGRMIGR